MNILIITTQFAFDSPNTICIKAIARKFVEHGDTCKILTQHGFAYDSTINDLFQERKKDRIVRTSFISKIQILMSFFSWPKVKFSGEIRLFNSVKAELAKNNYDVLIGYCNPFENLSVGAAIKRLHPHIVFCAYYLDSVFDGPVPTMFSKIRHDKKALAAEIKTLKYADDIVMMKSAQRKYEEYKNIIPYFNKIKFLDLPLYNFKEYKDIRERKYFPTNQIVILYAGSMPYNIRPPKYILELFTQLNIPNVHLYIAGKSDYHSQLLEFASVCPNIHILGQVSHEDILDLMMESDYLLNIGNSITGMLPCKIFEYMSLGKPIISTIRVDNDQSVNYFRLYKNCVIIDERETIELNLDSLSSFLSLKTVAKSGFIDDLYYNTPDAYVSHIHNKYECNDRD